ncbi:ATP-binding protein [bacterium]|nr:ATP-binding protein [bacterium]
MEILEQKQNEINLSIPSKHGMEVIAAKLSENLSLFKGFEQKKIEQIKMAIIEACINAFEHGSDSKEKVVKVDFLLCEDKIEVTVTDTGKGFDVSKIKKHALSSPLKEKSKRGWGIQLIHKIMDEVEITSSSKGTIIKMSKFK